MIKFLIDNNISPRIADAFSGFGFHSVHVKSLGMSASTDYEIFNYAFNNDFTIISADTDFGFILSSWGNSKPSIILLRMIPPLADTQIKYLNKVVRDFENEITQGSLLIVSPEKVRIRKLPLFI